MKTTILSFIVLLLLGSCSNPQTQPVDVVEVITENQLKEPGQNYEDLPVGLKKLVDLLDLETIKGIYSKEDLAKEDYKRFTTLVVSKYHLLNVAKKGDQMPHNREQWREFFLSASQDNLEWNQTIAIWGLGEVGTMDDMQFLISKLDDENPVVVDEALLSLEVLFNREQKSEPVRVPASQDGPGIKIRDVGFWKDWAQSHQN